MALAFSTVFTPLASGRPGRPVCHVVSGEGQRGERGGRRDGIDALPRVDFMAMAPAAARVSDAAILPHQRTTRWLGLLGLLGGEHGVELAPGIVGGIAAALALGRLRLCHLRHHMPRQEQLGAAEDRINRLETEIERVRYRAVRAESWLEQAQEEIEEKLIEPATAARSKLDDLGP